MFCPHCNILINAPKCPICGSKNVREPYEDDYCYLVEKDAIWSGAFSEILEQNQIPFVTKNVLGAGLTAKIGTALERIRFYVPYAHYQTAHNLEQEFFSTDLLGGEVL